MTSFLSVRDLQPRGKRVFCRVDFNVPMSGSQVTDDSRIVASLPTIRWLLERGGRVILASHLGRPKGKPNPTMSLAPATKRLSELLDCDVPLASDCVGPEIEASARSLEPGRALVLENLRFHSGEEANDPAFSDALARLAEIYVNDAFGTAHRAHASTVGIARRVEQAAAGFLMESELRNLSFLLASPRAPYVAVLGGAKVSDKLGLLENLMTRVDRILIGGAMAYTFLKGRGIATGASRVENEMLERSREIIGGAAARGVPLELPEDHRVRRRDGEVATTRGPAIPDDSTGLDIGPATASSFAAHLAAAGTILWNGPVGLFEEPPFDEGSRKIAEAIASSRAHSVAGGGDTASALRRFGLVDRFTHVSTGGGATLEFLSGISLPGVEALSRAIGGRP